MVFYCFFFFYMFPFKHMLTSYEIARLTQIEAIAQEFKNVTVEIFSNVYSDILYRYICI